MSKLKEIKLGDYIDILTDYHSGGSYKILKEKTKILYEKNYAIMIRTLNFENDDFKDNLIYVDKNSYDFLKYSHVNENDILINKIANPGSIYIMPKIEERVTCGMNLFLLRFKNINQRYIYYVLKNAEKSIKGLAHGTTTKTITKDDLRNVKINIHESIVEQQKVEKILSQIDYKLRNNKKIIEELESMAKTIYDYWFLQYEFPNESGKSFKSSGGKMVYNEKIKREIPEGWKVSTIGNVIIEKGKSPIQVGEAKEKSGIYPFFTSGSEIYEVDDYLTEGRNCFLSTGGKGNVQYYVGKSSYSTDTWAISSIDNLEDYLYLFIKSIENMLDIKYFAGTGLQHLQKDLFKSTHIVVPDEQVLNKFNKISNSIFNKMSSLYKENKELENTRDELLPLLMNGQVSFKN